MLPGMILWGVWPGGPTTTTYVVGAGSYTTWSLMGAIIGPIAPESIRARWVSLPQAITVFSSFIAPYVGGVLYSISPSYPFIVGTVKELLATKKL